MARLTLGPVASAATGRIGRIVMRRTRYGTVAQSLGPTQTYTTPAAILSKDRFRIAQRAWATMPVPLALELKAEQKRRSLGTPGPWFTTWMAYAYGRPWHYGHVPNNTLIFTITGIYLSGIDWIIVFTGTFDTALHRATILPFHPSLGIADNGWGTAVPNTPNTLWWRSVPMPPGSSLCAFPRNAATPYLYGIGDAHPLP